MRVAVISDIHANELALDAVRIHADEQKVDQFWCLGDIVGYGPEPITSLLFVKKNIEAGNWVMGNHDAMLADLILPQDDPLLKKGQDHSVEIDTKAGIRRVRGTFLSVEDWEATNAHPIHALELNRKDLDGHPEATKFWRSSFVPERMHPVYKNLGGCEYTLVHASQKNFIGRYLYAWQHEIYLPAEFSMLNKQFQENKTTQIQLVGHTHVATLVHASPVDEPVGEDDGIDFRIESIPLEVGRTYELAKELSLINPGSVGQPRDKDLRASYAIMDTDAQTIVFWRAEYEYRETARRLLAKGYPEGLARRLLTAEFIKETPENWQQHYEKSAKGKL